MVLHCWLGQIEDAAYRLVSFSLHHKRKHLKLSLRQPEIRRRDPRPIVGKPLFVGLSSQWLVASKALRGDMHVAGKDELQRPHVEGADEVDDQNCRRSLAQLRERGIAVEELRELSGLTKTEYESKRAKIRRRIEKAWA